MFPETKDLKSYNDIAQYVAFTLLLRFAAQNSFVPCALWFTLCDITVKRLTTLWRTVSLVEKQGSFPPQILFSMTQVLVLYEPCKDCAAPGCTLQRNVSQFTEGWAGALCVQHYLGDTPLGWIASYLFLYPSTALYAFPITRQADIQ